LNLEEFTDFLDEQGFNWVESGKSIALQDCPECGGSNYKVRLRVFDVDESEPFFGRCQRGSCHQGYSSISWLLKMEVPYTEVMGVHGLDPEKNIGGIVPEVQDSSLPDITAAPKDTKKDRPDVVIKTDWLKTIDSWPDHPVSVYAKKRGYVPEFSDIMQLDSKSGAVVFLVRDDKGDCIGFQKRFLYPSNPKMKTKSSDDFKPSEYTLTFHRPGADVVMCEGPFTALSAWHYGFTGVCTFGAFVGDKQIKKVIDLAVKEKVQVGTAFDDDNAGLTALGKIARFMYWEEIPIFQISAEEGNDLNDSWQAGKGFERRAVDINPAIPDIPSFI